MQSAWYPHKDKAGQVIFYYNPITWERKWNRKLVSDSDVLRYERQESKTGLINVLQQHLNALRSERGTDNKPTLSQQQRNDKKHCRSTCTQTYIMHQDNVDRMQSVVTSATQTESHFIVQYEPHEQPTSVSNTSSIAHLTVETSAMQDDPFTRKIITASNPHGVGTNIVTSMGILQLGQSVSKDAGRAMISSNSQPISHSGLSVNSSEAKSVINNALQISIPKLREMVRSAKSLYTHTIGSSANFSGTMNSPQEITPSPCAMKENQISHCGMSAISGQQNVFLVSSVTEIGQPSARESSSHQETPNIPCATQETQAISKNTTKKLKKLQQCSYCSKLFNSSSRLVRHLFVHTGVRPYPCQICDKAFIQPSDRTKHMRTHTGEKPYRCSQCGSYFREISHLTRHIRTHTTKELLYKCLHCNKGFSARYTLQAHQKTKAHLRKLSNQDYNL